MTAFEEDFAPSLPLAPEAQDLLFRTAATATAFADEPVTEAQVRAVYELAKWGPTAMNAQPLRMVLVRSPEARARLATHLAAGNRAKTLAAPLVAVLAADVDFHEELPRVFPVYPQAREAFAGDEAGREETARFNAALQMGYFIVAARAAGLAAGPMSGFDADGLTREFFPDGRHRALLVVNLGRATATSYRPRQPRLDYDEVVSVA
ncbi:MAG: malonic semialdehyde reductase [Actinomycetes bacterium]